MKRRADRSSRSLDLRLLRHLQCFIHIDPEIANRALDLRVAEQYLYRAEVLGSSVDQRDLRAPHRVSSVRMRLQARLLDPAMNDPRVLSSRKVRRRVTSAREKVTVTSELSSAHPFADGIARLLRNLELNRARGLLLHHRRATRDLFTMRDVSYL